MESYNRESIVRNLIAKILANQKIESDDYDIIVDSLQKNNNDNKYLIYALKYLNISSNILDILISSYETKELFYFLNGNDNKENKCNNSKDGSKFFEPMTKEKALQKVFEKKEGVKFPLEGETGEIRECFQFFEPEERKYYECERFYLINHKGEVVEFLEERITPKDDKFDGLYTGVIGEDFFNSGEADD